MTTEKPITAPPGPPEPSPCPICGEDLWPSFCRDCGVWVNTPHGLYCPNGMEMSLHHWIQVKP